ncbi:MAG: hypothetical protein R2834_12600 [Rhodothermales bacterium]
MSVFLYSRRALRRLAGAVLAGLILIPAPAAAQGLIDGFNKGQGRLDLALSYSWEQYESFYVGSEKVSEPGLGEITTQSVSLYAAYGLTSKIDLIVNLPFISARSANNPALDESALQDLALCVKARVLTRSLADATFKLFASVGAMTPTTHYAVDAPVAIGHRSTNLDGRAIAQVDLPGGAFVAAQAGYIWRSDVTVAGASVDVPGAFDAILRGGFGARRIYADGWAHLQRSGEGTDIGPGVPFPSNAISFLRLGGNLYTPLTSSLGVGVGFGYTVSGENVGKAFRLSGGVVYRL